MKYSVIGLIIWIGAGFLFIFQMISKVMPSVDFKFFTINQLVGLEWIESIPWGAVRPWAEQLAYINLSLLLLALGLIFIIIGMLFKT
ncbi:MAG: hypothetical protein ACLFS7_01620 [Desulfosudaceae bacterium]